MSVITWTNFSNNLQNYTKVQSDTSGPFRFQDEIPIGDKNVTIKFYAYPKIIDKSGEKTIKIYLQTQWFYFDKPNKGCAIFTKSLNDSIRVKCKNFRIFSTDRAAPNKKTWDVIKKTFYDQVNNYAVLKEEIVSEKKDVDDRILPQKKINEENRRKRDAALVDKTAAAILNETFMNSIESIK